MLSFSPFKTWRQLSDLALSPEEEEHVLRALVRMARRLSSLGIGHNIDSTELRYRIGEAVWQSVPCYIGWHHVRIKVDGTVLPCQPCSLSMGNLNEQSLQTIWNGRALKDFRQQAVTRKGLAELGEHCDCGFCCYLEHNRRIHKLFRLISPLTRPPGRRRDGRIQ